MGQESIQILFALLRSAIGGKRLTDEERTCCTLDVIDELLDVSARHDLIHLAVYALMQNDLLPVEHSELENHVLKAVYRYERLRYDYEALCAALEGAQIPFLPLKGSILRQYYPEAWMRTSCDIDVLVHAEDVDRAIAVLTGEYGYTYQSKTAHDVSLGSSFGVHVELHYDLIEDGRINDAAKVLERVWDTATLAEGSSYHYKMTDEMFCFYHIVHMAKHLVEGGCGIRPFLDLWIMKKSIGVDSDGLKELLRVSSLTDTYDAILRLAEAWFEDGSRDSVTLALEEYILRGGVYGSRDNKASMKASKGEGRVRSFLNLMFLSPKDLAMLYPSLNTRPYLYPFYQVKRWFRIFDKAKRDKVKRLTKARNDVTREEIQSTSALLSHLGLDESQN